MDPDLIVPIVLFLTIGFSYYFFLLARNKERLARIEKGLDTMPIIRPQANPHKVLTAGLFFIGISVGLFVGYFLESWLNDIGYFVSIMFFGGISLILSIFIKLKNEDKLS